ncbi:right-handed parallel beta-helix repeat-containing protein, partial [PVC group bacterium]|nr:right-handed parallel beta-helix repeat-containing protein [PVC group bacterium]
MKRTILYMLCVFMTGVVMSVYGGTYYVATNGLNANPGTETQPWRTIQKAGNTMTAGDIVLIRGGRYSERVLPGASGTSNAPIVYRAYPGETSILDGSGISMTVDDGLFELESLANIEIHDLYIVNSSGSGVLLAYSTNILVCGNTTSNTVQSGVGAWRSAAINIISNEIILACNDGENECITVDTTAGFSVCHNHVHHGGPGSDGGEGIDIKNGSHSGNVFSNHVHHLNRLGIYIDSWTRYTYDITVHNNKIHHCPSGIAVASEEGGLLQNVRVCNNIVYSNSYGLFVAGKWGVAPKNPISDIYILNNTFADNMDPSWGGGIMVENEDCTNIVIRNNICSQNESFQIAVETNVPWSELSIEYNLIDGYRGEDPDEETRGSNYVEGAALFLNRAIGDFRLQYGSPAIDNGTAEDAPEDDFSGRARPLDG